ncbi:TIGR03936 family radical SAM-associated protein [Eubacteriales bacterium KG127]
MSRYIFSYEKKGIMVYISHLDTQRLFRRTLKSCGYKIVYSHGFNPHPKMAIAQPLSLGYAGLCEYWEVELFSDDDPGKVKDSLNKNLPNGFKILKAGYMPDDIKSLSAYTETAEYSILIPETFVCINQDKVNEFLAQKEIYGWRRQKKTKKLVETPIKNKINWIKMGDKKNELVISVDCGSNSNLNPEILIKTFFSYLNMDSQDLDFSRIYITRNRITFRNNIDNKMF